MFTKLILPDYQKENSLFVKFEERLRNNEIAGIDVHGHIFSTDCVPDDYFEVKGLKKFITQPGIFDFLLAVLKGILPGDNDEPELLANYMEEGKNTQEQILEHWRNLYLSYQRETEKKVVVCPLTMDFEQAYTGGTKISFKDQITEVSRLAHLQELLGLVLPFVFADPRRENLVEILEYAFTVLGFVGAKYYPSLGILPAHPKMLDNWQRLAELGIPVMSHCGDGGVHTNAKKILVEGLVNSGNDSVMLKKEMSFSSMPWGLSWMKYFNNPKHWRPVLELLKGVGHKGFKLCAAHLAGWDDVKRYIKGEKGTWFATLLEYARTYPGFYFDVSFESVFPDCIKYVCDEILAKDDDLAKKVLFGLDNYMAKIKKKSPEMVKDALAGYRPYLQQIALENTVEFLRPN